MEKITLIVALSSVLIMMVGRSIVKQEDSEGGRETNDEKQLEVGDMAPTFKLKSIDGKEETDLEKFRDKKPVILFFGSYT